MPLGRDAICARGMSWSNAKMTSEDEVRRLLRTVQATREQNLSFFQSAWRSHDGENWARAPHIYRVFAERVLQLGEPLLAYDVVSEGLKSLPADASLRRLLALALARSGAPYPANLVLTELYREGHRDEESVGLLARTHKDLAAEADNAIERRNQLRKAFRFYLEAYRNTKGYWTGINAATLACLLNAKKRAAALALEVQNLCLRKLRERKVSPTERYWLLSTLGEAALVQQTWDEAARWYKQAVHIGRNDWGRLQATRHNARLLMAHFGDDPSRFESVFRFPTVVVFSGHLLDQPQRAVPRFPAEMASAVKSEIRSRVQKLNARIGYGSGACGADILFHEVMLESGGEVHVVLPYERQVFLRTSVNVLGQGEWGKRFEKILAKACEVQELSPHDPGNDATALQFGNRILHGLARLRAEQLETQLVPLAVWDGKAGDGPGGTAANVASWRRAGLKVEVIKLSELAGIGSLARGGNPKVSPRLARHPAASRPDFAPEIRALLFADFQGFSRLSDPEVPRFVAHCLGLVGKLVADSPHKPAMKNTWGDGLYMVFANMRDAGRFALELCARVREMNWSEKGLPQMKIRIGMHAGPVFCCTDPVTKRTTYIGAHVSRAARIEPVTPGGQVYASQAFAALAAAEEVREFRCDYVGQTPLAKHYGTYPTYVVLRRGAAPSAQ
jgi:class 3 adenylate cyclase